MKIAFIHSEKRLGTGAHFINELMAGRLRESGIQVKNFYPKVPLLEGPLRLKGISNILFFYSLLEHKDEITKYDLIQGTTYTPLAFLPFDVPIVSHFGSTSWGFLHAVPLAKDMGPSLRSIWVHLKQEGVFRELNIRSRRPLRDVAEIEKFVALNADGVIATSEIVRHDLLAIGVPSTKIHLVPNAIEDYWLTSRTTNVDGTPSLVFLGRLGGDAFTLKLKGLDRLIDFYQNFPSTPKHTFAITTNKRLPEWCDAKIPNHCFHANVPKDHIPSALEGKAGGILLVTSRYEGFSLSLVEGMSQGLIPVAYHIGIAPEIIQHGRNGFLIRSQAEGKKVIRKILGLPHRERWRLIQAAQATARQFDAKSTSRRLLEVYSKILRTKKS